MGWVLKPVPPSADKAKRRFLIMLLFILVSVDSCATIKSVGLPIAHNTRQKAQGAWMKDPLGIMGAETIFVMEGFSGNDILEEFENMDKFKAGVARKTYKLPYNWDGTGGVVYGPYLYYNK